MSTNVSVMGRTRLVVPVSVGAGLVLSLVTMSQAQTTATQRAEVQGSVIPKFDQTSMCGLRLGLIVRETPATLTVIEPSDVDAMAALDTQDTLKAIAGVSVSAQPGSPGSVFYRGFGAASLAQLCNGITVQYDVTSARPVRTTPATAAHTVSGSPSP